MAAIIAGAETNGRFSELMRLTNQGDKRAENELYELINDQLYAIASRLMRHQPPGHTLQTSDLVSEAYQKNANRSFADRTHFFALAARAMRSKLVDHARRRRGRPLPGVRGPPGDLATAFDSRAGGLLELDVALENLARLDEHYVRIVELRFFVGLPMTEVAKLLDLPLRNVERDWQFARDWLSHEIRRQLA